MITVLNLRLKYRFLLRSLFKLPAFAFMYGNTASYWILLTTSPLLTIFLHVAGPSCHNSSAESQWRTVPEAHVLLIIIIISQCMPVTNKSIMNNYGNNHTRGWNDTESIFCRFLEFEIKQWTLNIHGKLLLVLLHHNKQFSKFSPRWAPIYGTQKLYSMNRSKNKYDYLLFGVILFM